MRPAAEIELTLTIRAVILSKSKHNSRYGDRTFTAHVYSNPSALNLNSNLMLSHFIHAPFAFFKNSGIVDQHVDVIMVGSEILCKATHFVE